MARRGNYRMTPRRRAALRKAQLASARKRRHHKIKTIAKTAGTVAGGILTSAAIYHANRALTNPRAVAKDYRDAKMTISRWRGKDPNAPLQNVKRVSVSPMSRRSVRHQMGVRPVAGRRIRSR